MLLGDKHTSCCSCAKCVCGTKLPETVTLEIQGRFGPKEKYTDLVSASVKSTFGCGAQIRIKGPGGCETDARPLTREDIEIVSGGAGYAVLGRQQPSVTARMNYPQGYENDCPGDDITLTLAEGSDGGRPFWYVESVSGPSDCDLGGNDVYPITEFQEGTVVCSRPRYYRCGDGNFPDAVVVSKGYFYLPDASIVMVADIDIELSVREPGSGSGATITAVVDEDPESETFGQIVDVVVSGGEDYLAWVWRFPCDCGDRTMVLPQSLTDPCLYRDCRCPDQLGPWLINIAFESCHGGGAKAHATAPVGIQGVDDGGLVSVALDSGGSGYALLGRVAPLVDGLTGGSGTEATIATTLTKTAGACGHPVWSVSALAVTSGGHSYAVGNQVTLTTSDGTAESDGIAKVTATKTAQPTLAVGERDGTTFSVSVVSNGDTPQTWGVGSVTVGGTKAGFVEDEQLFVVAESPGAMLAGSDVRVSVDEDTGLITGVSVLDPGSFAIVGIIQSMSVMDGGAYYREDAGEPALTTPVIAVISQSLPSKGQNAEVVPVVDTSPDSYFFGQITDLVITKAGTDYLAASSLTNNCYEVRYPGPPVQKLDTNPQSKTYNQAVEYQPLPSVRVTINECDFYRYPTSFKADCADFRFTIKDSTEDPCGDTPTLTVSPGGTYTSPYQPNNPCCGCCCDDSAPEVDIGPLTCNENAGTFYPHVTCEEVDCETDEQCCVYIDGVATQVALTASDCTKSGGTVPASHQVGCGQCDCTVDCGYDWTECDGYGASGFGDIAGNCGSSPCAKTISASGQAVPVDGPLVVNYFYGNPGIGGVGAVSESVDSVLTEIQSGGRVNKYMVWIRTETPEDFSTHCSPQFHAINGSLKYVFTNCATNAVEIHEMTDYWSLHEAVENGYACGPFAASDNSQTSNDPCVIELSCAP